MTLLPGGTLTPDGAWTDFRDDLYWEALEGAALGFVLVIRQGGAAPGRGWELVGGRMLGGLVQLPQECRGSDLRWERSRWRRRSGTGCLTGMGREG